MQTNIGRKALTAVFVIVALMTITLKANSCSNATQINCGSALEGCQGFLWVNGTCHFSTSSSQVKISAKTVTCPAQTFWSNTTQTCVNCVNQTESMCNSFCANYGYYWSSVFYGCLKCTLTYGSTCQTCNDTQCLSCTAGLVLDPNISSCVSSGCLVANCLTCGNTSYCDNCDTGYVAVSGVCYCSIDKCQMCSGQYCLQCLQGYQTDVTRTICQPFCIPNCLSCSSYFNCTQCEPNYYYDLPSYSCIYNCSAIDPNCIVCSSSLSCSQCASGFFLNMAGTQCLEACLDINCLACSNSSICTQCFTGFKVSNNSCLMDICYIDNCLSCSGILTCAQCALNTILVQGATVCEPSCLGLVPNCLSCSNDTTCQQCISGRQLINNTCSSICGVANCVQCASATTCLACAPGTLMGPSSLSCEWNCGINGCSSCSSATSCNSCYPGYTLSLNKRSCMIVCPMGYYLKNGACTFCLGNYCQQCLETGQCVACRELFYLNRTDFNCYMCYNIDPYCYTCMSTMPVCTSCVDGFLLFNNKCIQYTTFCTIPHCALCDFYSTVCLQCSPGYLPGLSNSSCTSVACIVPQFLIGSACSCGFSAYLWNGNCLPCPQNCLSCTGQTCTLCTIGFFAYGNRCIPCPQNCKLCLSPTTCISCEGNFMLLNSSCTLQLGGSSTTISQTSLGSFIICPAGCSSCDISTLGAKVCLAASSGYALVNQMIVKCASECLTCTGATGNSSNANCLSCYSGFNLMGGNCRQCSDLFALTCSISGSTTYSLSCVSGYTAALGICAACASNCLKCDISKAGSCDKGGCVTGFGQLGASLLCIACFNGCSACSLDPNICTACPQSQFLSNGSCGPCPKNCLSCSNAVQCITCQLGMAVLGSGACGVPPASPCVNFDINHNCIACDTGHLLVNGSCLVSLACNATNTCTSCNFNQFLLNGSCLTCPSLLNCASCSLTNPSLCFQCNIGFYLSTTSSCLQCPSFCSKCTSPTSCLLAAAGSYLKSNILGSLTGLVAPCSSTCLTCVTQPSLCTSCKSGFSIMGSQCIQINNFQILLVGVLKGFSNTSKLISSLQTGLFFQTFPILIQEIAKKLKFMSLSTFQQASVIKKVISGSVSTTFNVNGDSVSPQDITNLNTLTTMSVLSVSSTSNSSPSQQNSGPNIKLIFGVTVPVVLLVMVMGAIIFYRKLRAKKEAEQSSGKEHEHDKNIQTLYHRDSAEEIVKKESNNSDHPLNIIYDLQ